MDDWMFTPFAPTPTPLMRLRTLLLIAAALLLLVPIWAVGCGDSSQEPTPRRDRLNYPIGVTVHPDGDYLYVVNSNFDARYDQETGGSVSVIDADTLELLPERTPFAPSFSSYMELNADASKAYLSSRGGDAVVAYDVAEDGSALLCTDDDGESTSNPADCVVDRIPDEPDGAPLPPDPFGLSVYSIERDVGVVDVVSLAHLRADNNRDVSRVSTLTFPGREIAAASLQTAPLLRGSNVVTRRPGTQNMYVGGRNENRVAIFQPYINDAGEVEALLDRGSFALTNARIAQGGNTVPTPINSRGLVFDDDGDTLFAITQRPSALHVVDIGPADPDAGTGTEHRISASIPLPSDPTDIELHTTPDGERLAYVASYEDRSIQVVDVDDETLVDEILLDASPYDIAIDRGDETCQTDEQRCRAYVTLFNDTDQSDVECGDEEATGICGSLAVIDINPESHDPDDPELSRYHTVISKIQ